MTNNYKIFIVSVFSFFTLLATAQLPNAGFENWHAAGFPSYQEPDNWGTLNSSTALIQTYTTERANAANSHSGNYAIKLSTHFISFAGQTAPGITVSNATINTTTQAINGGFVYTQRPLQLRGWYKGTPAANDSSSIELTMWKWISGVRTVIGTATFYNSKTVGSYTQFIAAINYTNAANPDSALIIMSSSDTDNPVDGSVFYVDDLSFFDCSGFTATASSTNATCTASNGTATAVATGATSYLWSNPGASTTATATGLVAGAYTVTVGDANGCTATATTTVASTSTTIFSTTTSTGTVCAMNSGTATVTAQNGTGSFSYVWSNNAGTTMTVTNLDGGNYSVTTTDGNGCTGSATVTVNKAVLTITSNIAATTTACASSTGSVAVTPTNGSSPFTYNWNGNSGPDSLLINQAAGTYNVTITDISGCSGTNSGTISTPNGPSATLVATPASCNGGSDGSIAVTTTGGTGTITYDWLPDGQNTEDISGLDSGNYALTISDANNCTFFITAVVTEPDLIIISATNIDAGCFGDSTGSIDLTVTGGMPTYDYLWNNNETIEDISGLPAGTYDVEVTDDNGCTASYSYTVDEPTLLASSVTSNGATCFGAPNGNAEITLIGGTNPYSFDWSNGDSTSTANLLAAGAYTVTATDGNGCSLTTTATVSQPSALVLGNLTVTNASSSTANDGSITLTPTGGTPTYNYSWSVGNGTNLTPGNYCVTVTDANTCTASACGTVTAPTDISNISESKLLVYPNPANNQLVVETNTTEDKFNFVIYSIDGKSLTEQVITGTKTTINVEQLPTGFYTCQLRNLSTKNVSNTKLQIVR